MSISPSPLFQSQTRSQSPGDEQALLHRLLEIGFNRRREANPLATTFSASVIISPTLFQSQTRSQSPGDHDASPEDGASYHVSIADAKPIPWRHPLIYVDAFANGSFQSQTRSQSPGDPLEA